MIDHDDGGFYGFWWGLVLVSLVLSFSGEGAKQDRTEQATDGDCISLASRF